MLKFLLKIIQKRLLRTHARGQRHGKHVRLLLPARAFVGHAAHGQRKQHHGNAETICH